MIGVCWARVAWFTPNWLTRGDSAHPSVTELRVTVTHSFNWVIDWTFPPPVIHRHLYRCRQHTINLHTQTCTHAGPLTPDEYVAPSYFASCRVIPHTLSLCMLWPELDVWQSWCVRMQQADVQQPVGRCFTALASSMLSQCVQYRNASKFTAGFQHFPFIVLYRYGDTHWSWQIILFIIEHYPMHSIIRFISCPACLRRGTRTDIRVDMNERVLSDTWCDNIHREHFIWVGGRVCVCCAWEKHLTFSGWYRLTSSYRNMEDESTTRRQWI